MPCVVWGGGRHSAQYVQGLEEIGANAPWCELDGARESQDRQSGGDEKEETSATLHTMNTYITCLASTMPQQDHGDSTLSTSLPHRRSRIAYNGPVLSVVRLRHPSQNTRLHTVTSRHQNRQGVLEA